ncbi:hypothetical protein [Neptunicoccus sediminis]|uniref:hypothetical protein n=1 Tax=Neptunicoccus sediminis TaxID=1892596 RepID=UPI00084614BC|nr:hypothetical protein [Neptunicoccus sediminis]
MNDDVIQDFLRTKSISCISDVDRDLIVDYAISSRSYDVSGFNNLIDQSPDWASVLVSHIHLDHLLTRFLMEFCVRPKSVSPDVRRMSVLDKCFFLHGVGVLSDGSLSAIKHLNRVRNRFAHQLEFDVPEKFVSEYRAAQISAYGDRVYQREEYRLAEGGQLPFKTMLKLSVLFVEEERLAHLIMGLNAARARADLEEACRFANLQLAKSNT